MIPHRYYRHSIPYSAKQIFHSFKQIINIRHQPEQHQHKARQTGQKCLFFPPAVPQHLADHRYQDSHRGNAKKSDSLPYVPSIRPGSPQGTGRPSPPRLVYSLHRSCRCSRKTCSSVSTCSRYKKKRPLLSLPVQKAKVFSQIFQGLPVRL